MNPPNTPPKVSVVMPVYKAERYLAQAVDSILAQSFPDFELLAVNDGSPDGSGGMLESYSARDSRVKQIHRENGGVTAALQTGIAAAQGLYIARMDSDDIALPERFARQVAYLDAHPDIAALGTQFLLIDPDGRPLKQMELPLDHAAIDARLVSEQGLALCHPSVMMRADVLAQLGGYDTRFPKAQDIELFLRMGEVGRLANLPEVLMEYRQHPDSIGYADRSGQAHLAWRAGKEAAARRGLPFDAPEPTGRSHAQGRADIWRKWGWWALSAGHVATARHYGRRAVLDGPFNKENWRLAAMALRGR